MNAALHLNELETWLRGVSWQRSEALYLLIGVGLLLAWSLLQADAWRRIVAPILRALVLALFVIALAGPERVKHSEGGTKPVLIDLSASITPQMRQWTAALLTDSLKLHSGDPVVAFAATPILTDVAGARKVLAAQAGCKSCGPDTTDLESGLRRLAAVAGGGGGAAVVVTDGWENRGEASRAISTLVGTGLQLFIFTPPPPKAIPNVALTDLKMPLALPNDDPFRLGVTVNNMDEHPVAGTLTLFEGDRLIETRPVTLEPGVQRVDFAVRSAASGLVMYRALFKPAQPDSDLYPEDDSLQGWVGIGTRRQVLIFTDKPHESVYLETTARRLGLEPEMVAPGDTRYDQKLGSFSAVLIDNVPRDRMPAQTQEALEAYVQKGGSVAMVGGDRGFGLGGWEGSGIEKILPVAMKPPQHKVKQRALVLIIDKSLSMGRENKLVYAKAAARTAVTALSDDDLISVIGFDAQPFVVVPLQTLRKARPYFDEMINRLKAQGTTYLLPALKEAERDMADTDAAIKHVVILTDGETGGTAAMYYDLISSMHRDGGVTVSTIAIGREPNYRLLNAISQYGGGGFYHTDSSEALPELFLQDVSRHGGEMTMVESEFLPQATAPNPVLKEMAGRRLPPLKGYVSTALKPGAAMDVYVDRGGQREPVIASWHYGAGKAVAVTTDAGGRWASDWIRSNVFTNVWDRLLNWMSPQVGTMPKFDVAMGYAGGRIAFKLTDYDEQSANASQLVSARVTRPDGSREELVLSEDTPGELAGSFPAPRPGTYYIQLRTGQSGKEHVFPPLAYSVSPASFAEMPRPNPNYDLLEHLAAATGGRLNPEPGEVALARPKLSASTSLAPSLLIAAMCLLIIEALIRRLTV